MGLNKPGKKNATGGVKRVGDDGVINKCDKCGATFSNVVAKGNHKCPKE